MQKLYNIVKVMLIFALLFTQSNLYAQKYCVDCKADVKVVSDKQVLLEKIDLKSGTPTTSINTNLYVSYRSGNSQKFWTNLVIATAGVAVSTQLNKANLAEGKSANGISPLLPLGVSVATLPSIWKNRPRNVPQVGLWIQHRDTRGKLLETWEQPISSEAKNDAELLTVSIDKPLTAGTLEVYLQNGSKNGVYYWGYETTSKSKKSNNTILQNPPVSFSIGGCPDGYLPNGNGMCCNPFTGDCVSEGGGTPPPPNPTPPPTGGSCPDGYLPNGQGMCCRPSTNDCVSEGGGTPPPSNPTPTPTPPPTGGGCPEGYLPNGNGMCCNPFNGNCISEGSVPGIPPTSQQTYSGEWKCTSGLVPTNGGNCLDPNTGNVYFPVFVINSAASGVCEPGKRQIITDDLEIICISGTFIDPGVIVRPNRPNPVTPNHPGAVSPKPYEPIPFVRSGGSGGAGSRGNTSRGTNIESEINIALVTTPCLKTSLSSIIYQIEHPSQIDFINKLNEAFGFRADFQVTFKESSSVVDENGNQVAAQTGRLIAGSDNIEITLNTTMLPGTSTKFQKFAILHELMHAYIQTTGFYPDHDQMLGKANFLLLYNAVRGLGYSLRDTFAVILYASKDAGPQPSNNQGASPNFEATMSDYNTNFTPPLTLADIQSIGDASSNTTTDAQGNKNFGGGTCR